MVPTSNIIMIIIVGLGCVIIPIVAFIFLRSKSKNITGALLAGVLSFFIMQGVIRLTILQVLSTKEWYLKFAQNNFVVYVLILAFTAALFETFGRYFSMKLILKNRISYYAGISHGVGHGGIEMILLITLTYVSNLIISLQINSGAFQLLINSAEGAGASGQMALNQLLYAKDALINTPAKDFAIALVERFFTLFFHIGLSLMIAEGIVRKKVWLFTGVVLVLHTTIDTIAPILAKADVNYYVIEGVIGLFAVGMFIYTLTSKKRFEKINKVYPIEKEQPMLESDY